MGLSVDSPGKGKAHKLELRVAMHACFGVSTRRDNSTLHRANARLHVQLRCQSLRRKLVLRQVGVELGRIDKHCVSAKRHHHGNTPMAPLRLDLNSAAPTFIAIDPRAPLLAQRSCVAEPCWRAYKRALFSCEPEGDNEVIVEVKIQSDGSSELDATKSVGITNPTCLQKQLDLLSWCPNSPTSWRIHLRSKVQQASH